MHSNPTRASGHLRLVERKRGPVWYARIRKPDGGYAQPKIGPAWTKNGRPPAGHFTEQTATQALGVLLTEINEKATQPTANGVTFGFAQTGWLMACERRVRPSTLRDYRSTASRLLDQFGTGTLVDAITVEDVIAYRDTLIEKGNGARTIHRRLTILGGIFRWVQRRYGTTHNPVIALEKEGPSYTSGRIEFLTPEEVHALLRATPDEDDKALFMTAALTGLRQGELRALKWTDVDFTRQRVHVRQSWCNVSKQFNPPKGGKVRSVPMADDVVVALDALSQRTRYSAPDDLVFPAWDGTVQYHGEMRARFYAALKAAGLRRIRFHDLRHMFGTLAAQIPAAVCAGDDGPRAHHDDDDLRALLTGCVRGQEARSRIPCRLARGAGSIPIRAGAALMIAV